VRLEALRALSRVAGDASCARVNRATQDPAAMVSLMAIDLLAICRDETALLRLESLAGRVQYPSAHPPARPSTWHFPAHALVALARADSARAGLLIAQAAAHPIWQVRMYAARAAALVRDTASLLLLGEDLVPNVREAAIAGLGAILGHRADALYRQALRSNDYQLVRTAARVLAGTPARVVAAPALLEALEKMSLARAMTARDTRMEILNRLRETGDAILVPRLAPFLRDYDPVIADSVAAVIHAWSGERRAPAPFLDEDREPVRLSEVAALRGARLVVQMEGGTFEIALLPEEAPVTVARVARLVRSRYFTDLTFHRVAPNFVVQGGSPGANEYAGTPAYMRDELSGVSHARGTLGISTRGRDTGDGQLFINLRDNPRLDYDYTVWGRVVSGMGVVDAMQEGARIRGISIRLAR
jgi:cyclophilin family peptidyl-prolyl cis-trans isomerase/HEAT repeat protein